MSNANKIVSLIPFHEIEQEAQNQIYANANIPFVKKIAIMPDVHAGYDLPIGGVALVEDHISPSYVGYDIGCGMICYEIPSSNVEYFSEKDRKFLFEEINRVIPTGFTEHERPYHKSFYSACGDNTLNQKVNAKLRTQFGTLGGGNHFIEVGYNDKGSVFITIHSGSRRPGWEIGNHYMNLAKQYPNSYNKFFPIDNSLGEAYLDDMNFALQFALDNRLEMLKSIMKLIAGSETLFDVINENHNHAQVLSNGDVLHRKGATPANAGELGVIPGSMKTGVYITRGLGNDEYLCSASHGAGRKLSRGAAKKSIDFNHFAKQMDGIYANVTVDRLDEAPDAYKDLEYVMNAQKGIVVEVVDFLAPLINVKG